MHLRQLQNAEKRVAIILANYPNKDSRLGNGVGLDTPESVALFLKKLVQQGYSLGNEIPVDGEALITRLQQGITNDPEGNYGKEWRDTSGSLLEHPWSPSAGEFPSEVGN